MESSIGRLYVGASGFSYPSWRGGFYPSGTKPDELLRFYASRLPSVEINSTFYQLPSEAAFERWAAATPDAFRFAVKMNRRIVQFGNLTLAGTFCERVRVLGERLGPVRVVLARARDDGWLRLLLDSLDSKLAVAFDVRHGSWTGAQLDGERSVHVGALEGAAPFRYLRFREPPYGEEALAALAETIRPLLAGGIDVYAYFRHEEAPTAPAYAERLLALI